jgi:hypothetical protein
MTLDKQERININKPPEKATTATRFELENA